ncbi:MAG: hypothetical protein LLF94_03450, partial [Chlamydiales bacterium]|nr:hypothetical protein [Chlamydiales bacterium]
MSSITAATGPVPPTIVRQAQVKPEKDKNAVAVQTYTAQEFAQLFREQNVVKFPANTRIKILQIDPVLGLKVLLAANGNPKYEKLLKVFEEVLLLEAKSVTGIGLITQKQFKYSVYLGANRNSSSLTIHANKEFSLITAHGEIHTTLDRLFTKMQYDKVSTFTVKPNQLLTLHKVPKTIIKSFPTLKKKPLIDSAQYLSLSSPAGYA